VRRLLAAAAAVALVATLGQGCGAGERLQERRAGRSSDTGPVPVGDSTRSLVVAGHRRSYRVHRPATLPEHPPLVVVLHGGLGSGEQAEAAYGWDAVADREGFVVAYPDGLGRAWDVGGGCCGESGRTGVDDVAFVTGAVLSLEDDVALDPTRVYATGISNGGMLSYRLACDSGLFAAVAPVAATELGACADPAPLSVLHVHGLADGNVRYDGRPGQGFAHIDGPPVADVVAGWRRVDDCSAPTTSTNGPVTTVVAACPEGRSVELVTIAGAGHQWPGGEQTRPRADRPSTALDATEVIWQFFRDHSLPGS
jgi:polyhydroxybutyrate depolymerase